MIGTQIPLELISTLASIGILVALFIKYYQYKKKLDVLKGLDELRKQKKLTVEDKDFIARNLKEYKQDLQKDEERIKFVYPLIILIAGVLILFLTFQEAMIYLNVVVVAYIYLHVKRIHNRNFVAFLKELIKE